MPALIEGSPVEVYGSGAKPYVLKNTGGVHSCTCPAWRNQSLSIDRRTCKHLKAHCGDAAEAARIGGTAPSSAVVASPAVSAATRGPMAASAPAREETDEEVLAAVFGRPIEKSHVGPRTTIEMLNAKEREAAADPEAAAKEAYKQGILDRAKAEGRSLRQDEKAKLNGPPILLAHPFDDFEDLDPTGWWMSEKLDGVRGYWNGSEFVSRQGNIYQAPAWFKAGLPNHPLDGELWMGRKLFQKTISIVKRFDAGDQWKQIKYVVYDAPHLKLPFEQRMEFLAGLLGPGQHPYAQHHPHTQVLSRAHLLHELKKYVKAGAEGLMIRKPASLYEAKRSNTLLKVKDFKDAEAEVIGFEPGKGRHKGRLGALRVRMPNGKEFSVGTGLSDAERNSPPKLGQKITYSYTELTDDGIPKCAAFVCVRDYE